MARSKLHIKICSEFSFLDPLKNVYKIKNFGNLYFKLKVPGVDGGGDGGWRGGLVPLTSDSTCRIRITKQQ